MKITIELDVTEEQFKKFVTVENMNRWATIAMSAAEQSLRFGEEEGETKEPSLQKCLDHGTLFFEKQGCPLCNEVGAP